MELVIDGVTYLVNVYSLCARFSERFELFEFLGPGHLLVLKESEVLDLFTRLLAP
jgi:hypothetical protein